MRSVRLLSGVHLAILLCLLEASAIGGAQSTAPQLNSSSLTSNAQAQVLSNGIEVRAGELSERVIALRDDVLRVTFGRNGVFPEDASWAVLAVARHSTVPITIDTNANRFGFRTGKLVV